MQTAPPHEGGEATLITLGDGVTYRGGMTVHLVTKVDGPGPPTFPFYVRVATWREGWQWKRFGVRLKRPRTPAERHWFVLLGPRGAGSFEVASWPTTSAFSCAEAAEAAASAHNERALVDLTYKEVAGGEI